MKNKKYIPEKEFISIYERVPRFCVEVLVQTSKGIILTKRNIHPLKGYWHFTGGTVYVRESIEKSVKRVAKEELNLDVEMIKDIGVCEFINSYKQKGQRHIVSIAYLAKAKDLSKIKLNEQGSEFMFCKYKKDIPKHTVKEHVVLLNNILK